MKINLTRAILLLPALLIFTSCISKIDIKPVKTTSEPVYLTGKVLNHKKDKNALTIYYEDIASGDQYNYVTLIDSSGNFRIKFNQYYPQDVLIRYGDEAFPIIVHPKDSINIVFDADKMSDKEELAKTILFSGSSADENSKLVAFYSIVIKMCIPWDLYSRYEKEKNPDEIASILDSLKTAKNKVVNEFIQQGLSKELEEWIRNEVDFDFNYWLARYPDDHAKFNNLDEHTVVPTSFYDFMNIKFSPEYLTNSKSVDFIGLYRLERVTSLMIDDGKLHKSNEMWIYKGDVNKAEISSILKSTNDTLLREILIAQHLYHVLERGEIKYFEKYYPLFEKTVRLPFLREPLINKYVVTKENYEHPRKDKGTLLKLAKDTPADQIISKIIQEHQGKIIYLDIWATWCGACRNEMPYSIELMNTLNSDKVDFVYLCTDSEEDKWKALISELKIKGSHYLATPDQSRFVYKLFEMSGVPQYVLIDENGNIEKKGYQLRPSEGVIKAEIENLLKQ
jgi:thiol-disulfide isomerase/thioredoxin